VIVVGLSAGVVEGVGSRRRQVNEWRQAALDFTVPPVPARTREVACLNDRGEPDALLVIELEPSERVHANRREEVFLRAGDETRRLTPSQAQELVYDKGQAFFEGTPIDAGTDESIPRTAIPRRRCGCSATEGRSVGRAPGSSF
jgi:ATP-dependent DNA helicase RecG